MAAGRGEFCRSFLEGFERSSTVLVEGGKRQGPERRPPGPDRGRRGKKWMPGAAPPVSVKGVDRSFPEPNMESKKANPTPTVTSGHKENFIERLPSEILMKILSYLDASSLFCISYVSKCFHQIANDDIMWQKIYMSEFGGQTWKPKWADDAVHRVDAEEVGGQLAGHWKRMYFTAVAGQDINKWRRELREISMYTGLPRKTKWVLRNLNMSWELTVEAGNLEKKITLQQSWMSVFESSMILCWNGSCFPKYHYITNIQLHAVRKEAHWSLKTKKTGWRSLISNLDMRTQPTWFIGQDRLIRLIHLLPSFIVGIWRGENSVAFFMVCLHFHKLVERSLLGSPVCPYSEPENPLPADNSDPEFGLHSYSLHFGLHNTDTKIISGSFFQLYSHRSQIMDGQVELRFIDRTNLSKHRSLSGNIKMPWKSEELEGSVENCCIITLTLLDEFQKPFWCVSSPICMKMATKMLSLDYSGDYFLMEYRDQGGRVKMMLLWLEEQKQFFLIDLKVYIPVSKVNNHFSTDY
ncbi:F-box only protein 15-like isoform X1 [Xyrichtys novacula]|uniref:F-box only protein 15-like isoform X1 n=1 Tax=Xyrichtys novacula TaxID=13765 RepID=A0AAV1F106_XYRNO|nr:F-box only protein 15-like isoform X1 [Xyrichtys novacula]